MYNIVKADEFLNFHDVDFGNLKPCLQILGEFFPLLFLEAVLHFYKGYGSCVVALRGRICHYRRSYADAAH